MYSKGIQSGLLSLILLVGLSACSGGGDTPPTPVSPPIASAEGLWGGTITTTTTSKTVKALVLDNDAYWLIYYSETPPSSITGIGFISGGSSSQNGSFTSSDTKDFSPDRPVQERVLDATIAGTYTTKQSLTGKISYPSNPQGTFTTTYNTDYDSLPDVKLVAGTYTGPVAASENVSVTVSQTGAITGHSITDLSGTGCTFDGLFKARAHGNAFDVTITFHGQPGCSNGNGTVTGVGFFDGGKLYSAAFNDVDKTNGAVFIGTKQ